MENHKILVVEDDLDLREALVDTLEMADYRVVSADSAEKALQELVLHTDIHMIVSDVNMGGMSGHELLAQVKQRFAHIPMLLITAYASVSDSVDAMRLGAVDYLVKPFQPQLLLDAVSQYVTGMASGERDLPIAQSDSSKQLLNLASRVAQTDSTTLIVGESGTGKEVLARYVHDQSPRVNKPFIAINCAAIPENMLEAMLFGHEKGAYTGATSSAPGKFEQANGGTILLDEISEMDLGLQAKLLRVIQEKEVERLGGRKTIKLDVRVIATSNRDMRHYVAEGKFREDLYYRLSVLPLQWAPLRDRKEDILPLAEKLLAKHAQKQHRKGVQLKNDAKAALVNYLWPGNVRELDNVMQRALILQPGQLIDAVDLGISPTESFSPKPHILGDDRAPLVNTLASPQTFVSASDFEQSNPAVSSFKAFDNEAPVSASEMKPAETLDQTESAASLEATDLGAMLGDDLKKREFEIILQTLKQEGGSKKNTAGRLGISPRTLRYKIARFKDEGLNLDSMMAS